MKKRGIPKIGHRNLKTSLAVFTCMTLFQILDRESAFFACIASVVCMKDTVENSYSIGKNRLLGTLIGGLIGIFLVIIIGFFPLKDSFTPFITAIGISLSIYIFTLWEKPAAVIISCIVIAGIMCNHSGNDSISYAVIRMLDTFLGVIIALVINKYIKPPKKETES